MSLLLEPFSYEYMVKAIWVSALVGGTCAFLSSYLVLKGWSLIGDALAHAIVPGVALSYYSIYPMLSVHFLREFWLHLAWPSLNIKQSYVKMPSLG